VKYFSYVMLVAAAGALMLGCGGSSGGGGAPAPAGTVAFTTESPLSRGFEGSGYNLAVLVAGGAAPYTFELKAGALPDGLALVKDVDRIVIQGTPTVLGDFSATFKVTSADSLTATRTYTIKVTERIVIPLVSGSIPPAAVGAAYSFTFPTPTGGTGTFERWEVSSGALPGGIVLDPNTGQLSGTPSSPGAFSFGLLVHDSGPDPANVGFPEVMGSSLSAVSLTVN
jgi:hypothetical protein